MSSSHPPHCLIVRDAAPRDLIYTARQHQFLLPHGLFPRLGQPFLRRWHATFLDSPYGIALVAEQLSGTGLTPVGFLFGSTDQLCLVDDVVARHRLGLMLAGTAALLRRPRLAIHFVRTRAKPYLRRLSGATNRPSRHLDQAKAWSGGDDKPVPAAPVAVITAVAVETGCRSAGAGRALVDRFVARAAEAGTKEARLTTMTGSGGAGPFYEKLGWQFVEQHPTRDGVTVSTYRLPLTGRTSPCSGQPSVRRVDE